MSVFEVFAIGVSKNLRQLNELEPEKLSSFLNERLRGLWSNETFTRNSGAGVRGTTRLANLLPLAETFFRP
jgi:hypothetical protein